MVLDLPSDVWAQIDVMARERGVNLSQYAVARLPEAVDYSADYEVSGFADANDTPISAEEAAPMLPGVMRGLADEAAGRVKPLAQVIAETRARHNLPETWAANIKP